jgi:UDP-N-acetyl-D-mannosaminouronate:lipid I N-acetyl-D-mannosaminouronosyltransferase
MIGGIAVFPFCSLQQVYDEVFDKTGKVQPGSAVAINPEKILAASRDKTVKQILSNARITFADGIGVVKALKKKTNQPCIRVPGCELWLDILRYSREFNTSVALIGAKPNVLSKCNEVLLNDGINIVYAQDGYFKDEQLVIQQLVSKQPQIVILALGSPKQEKLIARLTNVLPETFFMGVGGSFDVLTGNVKRAPEVWIKYNLEWLYRLLDDPSRIFRQVKLLKFVWLYVTNKL